jgi:hypothetical protein
VPRAPDDLTILTVDILVGIGREHRAVNAP